jgi:alpha-galactosidase
VITLFKDRRELLFTGDLVRADRGEDSLWLTGVVSPDRSRGLFALSRVTTPDVALSGRVRIPGLDPARRYRLVPREVGAPSADGRPRTKGWPAWAFAADGDGPGAAHRTLTDGVELPGSALVSSGVAAPSLRPESLVLLEVSAVDG